MSALLFLVMAPLLLLRVLVRRLVRGRRRPSWGFALEAVVEVLTWFVARAAAGLKGKRRPLPFLPLGARLAARVERQPDTLAGLRAEWIAPKGPAPKRLVLYLHGGAWVTCSIDTHRELMCRLSLAGEARVVGVDYRLAPEDPFPAGLDDCVAAYRELLRRGEDPRQLIIAGDSAGGNLALSTMLRLRDERVPLPSAAVLLSPAVELGVARPSLEANQKVDYLGPLATQGDGLMALYLAGKTTVEDPLVSPLHASLEGLPPLLLLAGDAEVLHDQIVAFGEKATQAGVPVELLIGRDMVHVWPAFAGFVPEAKEAVRRAGEFIRLAGAPVVRQKVSGALPAP